MKSSVTKSSRSERGYKSTPAQRQLWRDAARKYAKAKRKAKRASLRVNIPIGALALPSKDKRASVLHVNMSTLVYARKVKKLVIDRVKATSDLPELEVAAWYLAEEVIRSHG